VCRASVSVYSASETPPTANRNKHSEVWGSHSGKDIDQFWTHFRGTLEKPSSRPLDITAQKVMIDKHKINCSMKSEPSPWILQSDVIRWHAVFDTTVVIAHFWTVNYTIEIPSPLSRYPPPTSPKFVTWQRSMTGSFGARVI
jgi:hypothetical protein